jgi:hypothetical protein
VGLPNTQQAKNPKEKRRVGTQILAPNRNPSPILLVILWGNALWEHGCSSEKRQKGSVWAEDSGFAEFPANGRRQPAGKNDQPADAGRSLD